MGNDREIIIKQKSNTQLLGKNLTQCEYQLLWSHFGMSKNTKDHGGNPFASHRTLLVRGRRRGRQKCSRAIELFPALTQ